uniref:Uncharacterized protein n=1 Tax=Trypanosoma congolense (strain IL3000) TaxID=1068625 RepID=G0UVD4_TRYCI|nr:conserved hypothetical protein [Trypanosoma congolense IL3000]
MAVAHHCPSAINEERQKLTAVKAINIQQRLRHCGAKIIAAEPHARMFPKQYASPLQMLRYVETPPGHASGGLQVSPRRGDSQEASKQYMVYSSQSNRSYFRVDPLLYGRLNDTRGRRSKAKAGGPRSFHAVAPRLRVPPFPSIAARLENDVALGLAVSLWPSGDVVGHCDDRVARLLVLASTIVRYKRSSVDDYGCHENVATDRCIALELRHSYMEGVEHLVSLEHGLAESASSTPLGYANIQNKSSSGSNSAQINFNVERQLFGPLLVELPVWFPGTTRFLKGLIEPAALCDDATAARTWQDLLTCAAADVAGRYDILDAMSYTLEPCPGLVVGQAFSAVARRLALEVLQSAGKGSIGDRGAIAAIRILQHLNMKVFCQCSEERVVAVRYLESVKRRLRRLRGLLSPEVVEEATHPTLEVLTAVQEFCSSCRF